MLCGTGLDTEVLVNMEVGYKNAVDGCGRILEISEVLSSFLEIDRVGRYMLSLGTLGERHGDG